MALASGGGAVTGGGFLCLMSRGSMSDVQVECGWGEGIPCLMSRGWGLGTVPCRMSRGARVGAGAACAARFNALWVMVTQGPLVNRQTDTSEIITFPQLRCWAAIIDKFHRERHLSCCKMEREFFWVTFGSYCLYEIHIC